MLEPARTALDAVVALATARGTWTVLIDGRSGAGKSTLARAIADRTGARLVRLDDLYPGWDGLAAGAESARRDLLLPRRAGAPASWRRWDWVAGRAAERHAVPSGGGLVCEGSGVLTRRSAPLADLAFWVQLGDEQRKRRALARDGDLYAPHWDRWAAQERLAIEREQPARLADRTVDGAGVHPVPSPRSADHRYRRRP